MALRFYIYLNRSMLVPVMRGLLSDLETALEPVRELYGSELTVVECVRAMVEDVELLRSEADRMAQVENFVRGAV